MKKIIVIIVGVAIVGGLSFYAGMKYSANKQSQSGFGNLTAEQRQQRFQQMGGNGAGRVLGTGAGQAGGGFVSGEILSKDNNSATIKLRDGGSKIILFSTSTAITKFVTSTSKDLGVGKNIMVNGEQNTDGSITAKSIQLTPVTSTVRF